MLFFKKYYVNTTEEVDAKSIIHDLQYAIQDSKAPEGLLTVIVPDSGAGLAIINPNDELIEEMKTTFDVFGADTGTIVDNLKREKDIAPIIQAAIMGRTIHLPFQDCKLLLDPYDEVILFDFEKKSGRREFVVQIISEAPAEDKQQQAQAARGAVSG